MAWSTSDRASRLPGNWAQIKAAVKRRARGQCEARAHVPGCDGVGTEVDHVRQGDDHSMANLQLLSVPCHRAKTNAETIARNKARARMRRRPEERHPGAIT